jgi:hypothetical protein
MLVSPNSMYTDLIVKRVKSVKHGNEWVKRMLADKIKASTSENVKKIRAYLDDFYNDQFLEKSPPARYGDVAFDGDLCQIEEEQSKVLGDAMDILRGYDNSLQELVITGRGANAKVVDILKSHAKPALVAGAQAKVVTCPATE